MSFLRSINEVRSINWGRTYLWDIKFLGDDVPSPFKEFFPAVDIEEGKFNIDSKEIEGSILNSKIPISGQPQTLTITFKDDETASLENWLTNWVTVQILNNGEYVAVLEESVKMVNILKMNSRKELIKSTSYWVYPEGSLVYHGNSESDIKEFSVEFIIAAKGESI